MYSCRMMQKVHAQMAGYVRISLNGREGLLCVGNLHGRLVCGGVMPADGGNNTSVVVFHSICGDLVDSCGFGLRG